MIVSRPVALVAIALACAAGGATAIGLWFFLTPADRAEAVSYDAFVADLKSGVVTTIHIDGPTLTYRVEGASEPKRTTGRELDLAGVQSILAMVPADRPGPRIEFER